MILAVSGRGEELMRYEFTQYWRYPYVLTLQCKLEVFVVTIPCIATIESTVIRSEAVESNPPKNQSALHEWNNPESGGTKKQWNAAYSVGQWVNTRFRPYIGSIRFRKGRRTSCSPAGGVFKVGEFVLNLFSITKRECIQRTASTRSAERKISRYPLWRWNPCTTAWSLFESSVPSIPS